MAPDDSDPDSSEYQPLSDAIGVVLQSNVSSGPSKGNPVRSVSASAESVYFSPKRDKRPKSIAVGEVVGIRGLKLSMGSGPEGSSVLYMSCRNVHLESGSQLASDMHQHATRSCGTQVLIGIMDPSWFPRPLCSNRRHRG